MIAKDKEPARRPMPLELYWEDIDSFSSRAKVPGGWLVRSIYTGNGSIQSMAMAFVPDPNHEWGKDEGREKESV